MNLHPTHRQLLALFPIVALTFACRGGGTCCGSAAGNAPSPAANQAAAKSYVCPMHADVVASTPGSCPKCGMALVAKE